MDFEIYKDAINSISAFVTKEYFDGNEDKFIGSRAQLFDKFEENKYYEPQIVQPIDSKYYRNNFVYLCQNRPELVGSVLYLNTSEPKHLINDLSKISNSGKLIWNRIPSIKTIAAAEQIFQKAKEKTVLLLNSDKVYKKDIDEILNTITPLIGAKLFKDIQFIYWILYCELRLTLQLIKPQKDFNHSFSISEKWLKLRSRDVPLLSFISKTDLKTYSSNTFRNDTKAYLNDFYNQNTKPVESNKLNNIISDSAIKIKMSPYPERESNNNISINNTTFKKAQNYTFDFLYYLLWLRKNLPDENASIKRDGTIPTKYLNEMLENDKQSNRFQYTWNFKNHTEIKKSKSRTVNIINNSIMKTIFNLGFDMIIKDGDYFKLTSIIKSENIVLESYKAHT